MSKKMIVYHHNDHDGIAAAAVWKRTMKDEYDIEFNMIDYDKILNFDHIDFNEIESVVFLDYSFSNKENKRQFKELLKRRKNISNVIWIDHHKTSVDFLDELGMKYVSEMSDRESKNKEFINSHIMGMVRVGLSASALTYILGNCDYMGIDSMSLVYLENWFYDCAPTVLKFIDDYDCWKHVLDDTEFVHYGLSLFSPDDEFFGHLLDNLISCRGCIERGKAIMEYLKFDDKNFHINMYGFEHTIKLNGREYRCFCLNRKGNSIMFGDKIKQYDAVIPFYFINGKWKYSIFTIKDDINCEEIAKSFGGGGHLKAAGWITDKLMFE